MSRLFAFPNPVNEYAARVTAGLVVIVSLIALITQQGWLMALIALGFVLRALWGPKYSPLAIVATRVIVPRLGKTKLVPGPPKRFAQGIGSVLSIAASLCYFAGAPQAAALLISLLILAAAFESILGICFGCLIFGLLQRAGIIPESVCEACNNITLRSRA